MFIGHYGPALAAKAAAPRLPLWSLFLAAQLLDILIVVLLRLGIEKMRIEPGILASSDLDLYHIPYSHGLLAAIGWSLLAALVARLAGVRERRVLAAIAAVVLSHWLLDAITHPPDLPLWGDRPKVGLGLWASPVFSLAVELGLFAVGLILYLRVTRGTSWSGRLGIAGLALLLVAMQLAGQLAPSNRPKTFDSVTLFGMIVFPAMALLAWLAERSSRSRREDVA